MSGWHALIMGLRRALALACRAAACAGCLAGATGPLRAQDTTVALTIPQARALARQALDAGQPQAAGAIARALLQKDRNDVNALLLLSAAEGRQGHGAQGVAAGRQAFRLSDDATTRFEAAFLTGLAHAGSGQGLRAKLWLRRAAHHAPDPALRAVAIRSFREVQAQSRLSLGLSLQAGPSANVNGGSLHDTFYIIGIPFPIDEALPGGVYSGAVSLRYRLAASATGVTELTAGLHHRGVWLSDRAKAMQPGAQASDYAATSLDLGLTRRWKPGAAPVVLSFGASIGTQFFGGAHLTDRLGLDLSADHILSATRRWRYALVAEQVWQPSSPVRNATILAATATVQQALGGQRGSVSLSFGGRNTWSDAANVAHSAITTRAVWLPDLLPGGIAAELGLGLELRDYGLAPTPHPDRRLEADLGLTFTEVDYMGFSPRLQVRLSRTFSDFVLRDTRDISLGLGLRSAF